MPISETIACVVVTLFGGKKFTGLKIHQLTLSSKEEAAFEKVYKCLEYDKLVARKGKTH